MGKTRHRPMLDKALNRAAKSTTVVAGPATCFTAVGENHLTKRRTSLESGLVFPVLVSKLG